MCLWRNKLINLIERVEKENLPISVLKSGNRKMPNRFEHFNFLCFKMNAISALVGLLFMLEYKK